MNLRRVPAFLPVLGLALASMPMQGAVSAPGAAVAARPGTVCPDGESPGSMPGQEEAEGVTVLGYGFIGKGKDALPTDEFRRQMSRLQLAGYTPVTLADFLEWKAGRRALPERSVLITFDEVRDDWEREAWPVLQHFGYPFLLFVDGRHLNSEKGSLPLARLQALQRAGATIGSHSLRRLSAAEWLSAELAGEKAAHHLAEQEMGESARRIREAFGSCEAFSYPEGFADVTMLSHMAPCGYRVAFSLREGKERADSPSFMVKRWMIRDASSFARALGAEQGWVTLLPEDDVAEEADEADEVPEAGNGGVSVPGRVGVAEAGRGGVSIPARVGVAEAGRGGVSVPARDGEAEAGRGDVSIPGRDGVAESGRGDVTVPGRDGEAEAGRGGVSVPGRDGVAEAGRGGVSVPGRDAVAEAGRADVSVTGSPEMLTTEVEPTCGLLGRRSPGEDWVTVRFDKPLVPRDRTRVAVLGYHNFSNVRPVSEMRMRTAEFCQQMQYLREAGLSVISMQDFLEWLRGERCLPERCVLITIDDGWKSVYTDAYPVLKAYGYPFTLFLYTRYINVKGDSMTTRMIREMMAHGATIGSHSTSHLYPRMWKRFAQDSPEYAEQVQREIPASGEKLASLFGRCSAYCYPGGYHTPPMLEALEKTSSFRAAFTVLEAKVTCDESPYLVHRYMIFGNDSRIFRRAVNFDGEAGVKPAREGIAAAEAGARAFFPRAFEGLATQGLATQGPATHPAAPEKHRPVAKASRAKKTTPRATNPRATGKSPLLPAPSLPGEAGAVPAMPMETAP